jgi:DNA-binding FrmR family transcriptional regulator
MKAARADRSGMVNVAPVTSPYLTEASAKALRDRLSRIEGHVRAVRQMVDDHRCADEILLQVAAVKAALNQVASQILDQELTACMNSCMEGNAEERLRKVTDVLTTLLRQS